MHVFCVFDDFSVTRDKNGMTRKACCERIIRFFDAKKIRALVSLGSQNGNDT